MLHHNIFIENKLASRKAENAFRELKQQGIETPCLVDFCSNDYLGFAKEKEIHHIQQGVETPCCDVDSTPCYGATGSRLISGNYQITEETEKYLANFYHSKAALIFNAGYNANMGLFQCLPQRNDTVIFDEYIHASIRDGIKLSNAKNYAFEHNNLATLEQKLKHAKGLIYVAVESIYSMDGDAAPLKKITELCAKYNAALIVDEAHAVGIFGNGRGLVVELGLENNVFARIVTFGKAFGGHGAAILGSNQLRDYLINFSRAFIYTTALPLQRIISIKNAHEFLLNNLNRIDELKELINYFNEKLNPLPSGGLGWASNSAIQCIIVSGNDKVKKLAENIQKAGFDVRPILSPTVPKGKERLRICLHSFNTKEEVDRLINLLNPPSSEETPTENTLPLRGVGGVITKSNNLLNKNLNPLAPLNHPPYPPSREETTAKKTSGEETMMEETKVSKTTTDNTLPLRGVGGVITYSNNLYNKNLKTFARENRKNMTKAEAKIWNDLLRKNQCFGLRFLRQRPILNYIADFMCPELKLIVEIDGYSHHFEEVFENDIKRQKILEENGYTFLRFDDNEVMSDFDNVIRTFEIYLENIKR